MKTHFSNTLLQNFGVFEKPVFKMEMLLLIVPVNAFSNQTAPQSLSDPKKPQQLKENGL